MVVAQIISTVTDPRDGAPLMLMKGGTSITLRRGIERTRATQDVDFVRKEDVESLHEKLVAAGRVGWQGFHATFTEPKIVKVPGLPDGAVHRFDAKMTLSGKPFMTARIEVSDTEAGNADEFDPVHAEPLSLVGFPSGTEVPCMTIPWQIAQKIHACTCPSSFLRGTNERAHDLIDLQILEGLVSSEYLPVIRDACSQVFEARAMHSWPPDVNAPPGWDGIYERNLGDLKILEVAPSIEEAVERVQRFIDRIHSII